MDSKVSSETKRKTKWVKPAYKDVRLGFEYTLYAMTR